MQALFDSWWFGGILFPLLASIITGVWTGLAVTRYLMFYQETQRAREKVMTLFDKISKMIRYENEAEAGALVLWLIIEPTMALWAQGHWHAGWQIKELSLRLQEEAMKLHAEYFRILPKVPHDRHEELIEDALEDGRRIMERGIKDLGRVAPNMVTVIFGVKASRKFYRTGRLLAAWREHMETGEPMASIRERQAKNEPYPC